MSDPFDLSYGTTTPILAARKAQQEADQQSQLEGSMPVLGTLGMDANPQGLGPTIGGQGPTPAMPQNPGPNLVGQAPLMTGGMAGTSISPDDIAKPPMMKGDVMEQGLDDASIQARQSPMQQADMSVAPRGTHGFWGHLGQGLMGAARGLANMNGGLPGEASGILGGIIDSASGDRDKRIRERDVQIKAGHINDQRQFDLQNQQVALQRDNIAADNKRADAQLEMSRNDMLMRQAAFSDERVYKAANAFWSNHRPIPKGTLPPGYEQLEGIEPPKNWSFVSNGFGTVDAIDENTDERRRVFTGPDPSLRAGGGAGNNAARDDIAAGEAESFLNSPQGQTEVEDEAWNIVRSGFPDLANVDRQNLSGYKAALTSAAQETTLTMQGEKPTQTAKMAQEKLKQLAQLEAQAGPAARQAVYQRHARQSQGRQAQQSTGGYSGSVTPPASPYNVQ
jgi:hypothetical protein